jgi:hypothetical protein
MQFGEAARTSQEQPQAQAAADEKCALLERDRREPADDAPEDESNVSSR